MREGDKPGHGGGRDEHRDRVRALFDHVAGSYDRMNRLMTFGRDRSWRRFLIETIGPEPDSRLLDVATGTGDLIAEALAYEPAINACGIDFSTEMLEIATKRFKGCAVELRHADAIATGYEDGSFDTVVSAFLIRNVDDVEAAFTEQFRVLRPGGSVGCIDTTPPAWRPLAPAIRLYFRTVIPLLGRVVAGDVDSYRYLTTTTEEFKTADEVSRIMRRVGFRTVRFRRFMAGTIAAYWGVRPGGTNGGE